VPVYTLTAFGNHAGYTAYNMNPLSGLSDGSDATLGYCTANTWHCLDFGGPSSPSGRLAALGMTVRSLHQGSNIAAPVTLVSFDASGTNFYTAGTITLPSGIYTVTTQQVYPDVGWDPDALSAAGASLPNHFAVRTTWAWSGGGWQHQIAELTLQAAYLLPVSVGTPSAPTGTKTTQYPTLTVPISLTVESWQLRASTFLCGGDVEFQIFRLADAPGSTPPGGVTPVWQGTTRFSATTLGANAPSISTVPDEPLPDGTYVMFCRASRDLIAGSKLYWSSWSKSATWLQLNGAPINTPSVSAAVDNSGQRMAITVTASTSTGYDSSSAILTLQRQTAAGWVDVRGLTGIPLALGSPVLVGYDYEADRAVTNTYRARVSQLLSADEYTRCVSAWGTGSATGPTISGTGWNFKAVELGTSSWMSANVVGDPAEETQRVTGLLTVLDRDYPVSVAGTVSGMKTTYEVIAYGTSDAAALRALRDYSGLLKIEDPWGGSKYARAMKVSWAVKGTPTMPLLAGSVECAEVGSGLDVSAA